MNATKNVSLKAGEQVNHRYVLQDEGQAGGLGTVFKAIDRVQSCMVAIKVLNNIHVGRPERVTRFQREFSFLERVNSPYVVRGIEQGTIGHGEKQHPYLVLEYIAGITLQGRMCRPGFVAVEILSIAMQLATALRDCHRAGVVHRDLKPDNILLKRARVPTWYIPAPEETQVEWLDVKLVDFSHAGAANGPQLERGHPERLTSPLEIPGTVPYMGPEQARCEPPQFSMDIWTFGLVLHEMITGENPFQDCQPEAFLEAQAQGQDVPDIYPASREDLPEALLSLVAKCLDRDPAKRPGIDAVHAQLTAHWADLRNGELLTAKAASTNRFAMLNDVRPVPSSPVPAPPIIETVPDVAKSRPPRHHGGRGRGRYGLFGLACGLVLILGGGASFVWLRATGARDKVLAATSMQQEESEALSEATFQNVPDVEEMKIVPDLPQVEPVVPDQPTKLDAPNSGRAKTRVRKQNVSPCQDAEHAQSVVEAARTAGSERQWSTVVSLTVDRSCWREAPTQRVRLRVEALATLRRWSECADLGQKTDDPQIRAIAHRCREKESQ